uniref:phage NrS-1 polymerase family protein n=1 Tax=Halopiger xanaduensis TaxID=387343 RepID=UPI00315D23A1
MDDCRDPETSEPLEPAPTIIERLDSFTEVSPSGTGYHVILEGELPDGRNCHDLIEMYDQARFFTVTGDHVEGTLTSTIEQQEALEAIHDEYVGADDTNETDTSDVYQPSVADQTQSLELEDEELLEKARSASNGDKFDRLWRGNISGYESQSEADMALCCLLAFWTGRDATQMDRLFRQSGLMRDKWDEVHYADGSTYGEKTIERAIRRTDDVYEPSSETGTKASTNAVDRSLNETKKTDNGSVSTDVTADTEAAGGSDQAAYLAEKNQLVSERVAELEATLEQKDSRIDELEAENQALREALTACKVQLEDRDQSSPLEDTEAADDADSIWNRTKRLLDR